MCERKKKKGRKGKTGSGVFQGIWITFLFSSSNIKYKSQILVSVGTAVGYLKIMIIILNDCNLK